MFNPDVLKVAIQRPHAKAETTLRTEISRVLDSINASCPSGNPDVRKLSYKEADQIMRDLEASWKGWVDYESAYQTRSVPAGFDTKSQLENLRMMIDWRADVMANVLARVLDERVLLEIRFVRAGLGTSRPAAVPRGIYF